jgi:hypothetical protein
MQAIWCIVKFCGGLIVSVGCIMLFVLNARAFDPIWSTNEVRGTLVSWGAEQTPNVAIRYYKAILAVKADDGRLVSVRSERRIAPSAGERIIMQERVGWFGTVKYVEIPAR